MMLSQPDPEQAMLEATQRLRGMSESNPTQAGQFLVRHNLELMTAMSCRAIEKDPFPAIVKINPEADVAMEECDLEMWISLAESQVSASSLD
jgi:hypothetical protein